MGRAEPETLGDSDIMAIMGSFAFCCFFMPCVGASLEQALKNYYPATYLQSPHLQSCGSLQKKINVNHQTDFILVCVCGKGAKISKGLSLWNLLFFVMLFFLQSSSRDLCSSALVKSQTTCFFYGRCTQFLCNCIWQWDLASIAHFLVHFSRRVVVVVVQQMTQMLNHQPNFIRSPKVQMPEPL